MSKYKSLEAIIKEMNMNRNTELRKKVTNVGRPDTAENPTDVHAKLAKQAEIKTKIIDEAKDDQEGAVVAKKQSKDTEAKAKDKNSQDHLDDPRQIKGGTTQVDLNPKTDDKVNDDSKEDQKSKTARAQENKKIGAKGSPMKESNNLFGISNNLRDVARAILEKKHTVPTTDKEKKLAALAEPKDKITKKDILVGRGVFAKEEAEQIDEISKKTAMSAYQSASWVDGEHPKQNAIRGHIEKKWGKKMGDHADAHAHVSNYGRHGNFTKDDKLSGYTNKKASDMRMTKSGKINKQDTKAKASEIKSRLGTHTKAKLPEGVEFSAQEIARIEEIAKSL